MLSNRRRQVLNALIQEYISTATPVSSRAIAGNHKLGVSSATVRNELYVLEEDGYVISPHVSSGRIPTDSGYRTFVDQLLANMKGRMRDPMDAEGDEWAASEGDGVDSGSPGRDGDSLSGGESSEIEDELRNSASELDDLLKKTSRALNRFTDCLAVVMAPRVTSVALKRIALVPMDSRHVILVIAVKDGRVLNRTVELRTPHSLEEIRVLETMLNRRYDIKGGFDPVTMDASDPMDTGVSVAEAVSVTAKEELDNLSSNLEECLLEEEHDRVHVNGLDDLFAQPEMRSMSALTLGFARLLDDDLMIFRLLGDLLASRGVNVRIGQENQDESFSDISVVASGYGDDGSQGVVAIVGPTRMDYQKVIDAVRRASEFLDDTVRDRG